MPLQAGCRAALKGGKVIGHNRVVVTAVGVLAPNGVGKHPFWQSILDGRSGIGPITLFDAEGLKCRIAGEVSGFDPREYIEPDLRPAKRMGRSTQLGIAAARMALADADLSSEVLKAAGKIPIVMGVSSTAMELREHAPKPWTAVMSVPHMVGSMIARTCGIDARLHTVSTGCASGMDAIGMAAAEIRRGEADLVIAGAADSVMSRYVMECFIKSRKLSMRNDDPEHASRPFDRNRDGGIASEGAGVVVLENLEHARARGAKFYAEVCSYASSADEIGGAEGCGLEYAMRMALVNACRRPEQIDVINAHAPSDPHMDRIETELIKKVFRDHAYRIPVVSIKGVTGNPMGAGGVHQLICSVLSLRDGIIPPTANLEDADPLCDLDYVPHHPRRMQAERVLVNSHGFGRGNSCIVLQRIDS